MFKPKEYQEATRKQLTDYLEAVRFSGENGAKKAFDAMPREVPKPWNKPYVHLEHLPETPYVCLRLPTGGGKTFLAAQTVKLGAKF